MIKRIRMSNKKKIGFHEEKVIFQELLNILRHFDFVLWSITVQFGILDILIIWKFGVSTISQTYKNIFCLVKYTYLFLIGIYFLISTIIGGISMQLADLLDYDQLSRKKLREALKITKTKKFIGYCWIFLISRPYGWLTLAITIFSSMFWFKLFN